MTPLVLTLTNGGLAALRAAAGTNAIVIAQIGLSARAIVAAPTLTALPDEHRRLATVSGAAVDDRTVHLTARDDSDATYTVRAIGVYLSDGTLFATYAQADPIFEKARVATYLQAIDIRLQPGEAALVTFGDANFLYPPATQSTRGVAEIATEGEVDTGADDTRIVTPLGLARRFAKLLIGATREDADAGTRQDRYLTPWSIGPLLTRVATLFARRVNTDGLLLGAGSLATDLTLSVPPATADQLRNGTASNVAVTPRSFGDLGNVIGMTGSYTLPGGRIDKWGGHRGRSNSEISLYIPFATPFPNGCRVQLTPLIATANASDDYFCQLAGEPTAAGFTVQYQSDDANGGLDGFDWLAIGH
ncbi:hypothetical protein [uncultured Sphingomonas sp.]|uniref:gp53-like domain-containing protein n=1 Tax=uncultured Sphingomonas sp. TaxID=158754 RepID=UPI0025859A84|nr:hypothetical protein [uncultured Sphingomonas sp.]